MLWHEEQLSVYVRGNWWICRWLVCSHLLFYYLIKIEPSVYIHLQTKNKNNRQRKSTSPYHRPQHQLIPKWTYTHDNTQVIEACTLLKFAFFGWILIRFPTLYNCAFLISIRIQCDANEKETNHNNQFQNKDQLNNNNQKPTTTTCCLSHNVNDTSTEKIHTTSFSRELARRSTHIIMFFRWSFRV